MTNPRQTSTNAADSAPGVDDGRRGAPAPSVNSKPGGRRVVFWIVGLALAVLAISFIARPFSSRSNDEEMVEMGSTRGEIVASEVPGQSQPDTQQPTPPR
jgi:hypothetical protein